MDGGQSVELNEWLIVVGETTKLVAWGWKVSFVDAFVYQLKASDYCAFCDAVCRFLFFNVNLSEG